MFFEEKNNKFKSLSISKEVLSSKLEEGLKFSFNRKDVKTKEKPPQKLGEKVVVKTDQVVQASKKHNRRPSGKGKQMHNVEVVLSACNDLAEISQTSGKSLEFLLKHVRSLGLALDSKRFLSLVDAQILVESLGIKHKLSNKLTKKEAFVQKIEQGYSVKGFRHVKVGILGHIDHGKTTLLKKISPEERFENEVREITQKSNFYQLSENVFIVDTPGHNVFEYTRNVIIAHTDIILLVISAKEGVQEETKKIVETLRDLKPGFEDHALVVFTKTDIATEANLRQAKQQATKLGLYHFMTHNNTHESASLIKQQILAMAEEVKEEVFVDGCGQGFVFDRICYRNTNFEVIDLQKGSLHFADKFLMPNDKECKVVEIRNVNGKKIDGHVTPGVYMVSLSPRLCAKAWSIQPFVSLRKNETKEGDFFENFVESKNPQTALNSHQQTEPDLTSVQQEGQKIRFYIIAPEMTTALSLKNFVLRVGEGIIKIVGLNNSFTEHNILVGVDCIYIAFNFDVPVKITNLLKSFHHFDNIYDLEKFIKDLVEKFKEQHYSIANIIKVFDKDGVKIAGCVCKQGEFKVGDEIIVADSLKAKGYRAKIDSMRIKRHAVESVKKGDEFGAVLSNKGINLKVDKIIIKV